MRQRNSETGVPTASSIVVKKQALLTGDMLTDAEVRIGGGQFRNETQVDMEFSVAKGPGSSTKSPGRTWASASPSSSITSYIPPLS